MAVTSGNGGFTWAYMKLAAGCLLVGAVLVFTAQNAEVVHVRFLGWQLDLSLSLLIFLVLALGIVSGYLMAGWLSWRKKRNRNVA
jgi:uncharacterized integral membrane protein